MDKTEQQNKKPPFPALTSAQRLHFEIYGYVVIEKLLDANEVARIRDALQNLKRRFEATGNPYHTSYKGCSASGKEYAWAGPRLHFNHLIEADAAFLTYATYPRIVKLWGVRYVCPSHRQSSTVVTRKWTQTIHQLISFTTSGSAGRLTRSMVCITLGS